MIARVFGIVTLLLMVVAGAAAAQEQPTTIVVEGSVLDGTAGGHVGPGLPVFLVSSAGPERELQAATDEDGKFRFDTPPPPTGERLGVSIQYQGAVYGAIVQVVQGLTLPMTITVYDSSDDERLIEASSASLLFARADRATQTLWALEIVKLVNDNDQTYVPGPGPMQLLRFGLPPGADDLSVDTGLIGADVLQVDRGFAITAPVPPGEHEVMYAYSIPYEGSEMDFTKSLPYGAAGLRILVPEEVAGLSSSAGETERVTIGDRPYRLLSGTDLPRGAKVPFELISLPQASLGDRALQGVRWVRLEYAAVVGLGLVMASLIACALVRRGPGESAERVRLVRGIASLDAAFEAGEIGRSEYERARGALTASLTSLPGTLPSSVDDRDAGPAH